MSIINTSTTQNLKEPKIFALNPKLWYNLSLDI